jgi:hypothetical protein
MHWPRLAFLWIAAFVIQIICAVTAWWLVSAALTYYGLDVSRRQVLFPITFVATALALFGICTATFVPLRGWQGLSCLDLLLLLIVPPILSFRMVALPWLVLCLATRKANVSLSRLSWLIFVIASVCPVDVALPGYPGFVSGKRKDGFRMVKVVSHMPMRNVIVARYGEFMENNFFSLNPPEWVLVATTWRHY